jgi:hypothetical protein
MGKNFKNINEELERIKTLMFETDSLILNNKKPLNEQVADEQVADEQVADEQITGAETDDKFKTVRSSFKLAKVNDVNTLVRGGAAKFDTYKVKGTGVISLFDKDGKMTPEGIELMKKSGLKLPAGQIVMRIGKVDNPNTDKVFFQVIPAKELSIVTQSGDIKNVDPKELEKLPTVQDLKPSAPVEPTPTPATTDTFTENKDFLIGKKIAELAKKYNLKITDMTPQFKEQGWTASAYYKRNDETKTVYGVDKNGVIQSFFKRVKGTSNKGVSENFNMDLVFVNPLLFESVVTEQDTTKTEDTSGDYYIKMDGNGKETKMSGKFTQVVDGTYKGTPGGDKKKTGGSGKKKTGSGDKTTTKGDWSSYPCVAKNAKMKQSKMSDGSTVYEDAGNVYYSNGRFKDIKTGTMGNFSCDGDKIVSDKKATTPKLTVVTDKDLMGETGIMWNLMKSSVPMIVSLVTPFSIPLKILSLGASALMKVSNRSGVKGVVDALDGFVTADDLAYVLTTIKSLNGKVYYDEEIGQNIPATKRFLELYSEDEGGDSLIADVQSVGTRTLPTGSEKLKSVIVKTINSQASQQVSGVS